MILHVNTDTVLQLTLAWYTILSVRLCLRWMWFPLSLARTHSSFFAWKILLRIAYFSILVALLHKFVVNSMALECSLFGFFVAVNNFPLKHFQMHILTCFAEMNLLFRIKHISYYNNMMKMKSIHSTFLLFRYNNRIHIFLFVFMCFVWLFFFISCVYFYHYF